MHVCRTSLGVTGHSHTIKTPASFVFPSFFFHFALCLMPHVFFLVVLFIEFVFGGDWNVLREGCEATEK